MPNDPNNDSVDFQVYSADGSRWPGQAESLARVQLDKNARAELAARDEARGVGRGVKLNPDDRRCLLRSDGPARRKLLAEKLREFMSKPRDLKVDMEAIGLPPYRPPIVYEPPSAIGKQISQDIVAGLTPLMEQLISAVTAKSK